MSGERVEKFEKLEFTIQRFGKEYGDGMESYTEDRWWKLMYTPPSEAGEFALALQAHIG